MALPCNLSVLLSYELERNCNSITTILRFFILLSFICCNAKLVQVLSFFELQQLSSWKIESSAIANVNSIAASQFQLNNLKLFHLHLSFYIKMIELQFKT